MHKVHLTAAALLTALAGMALPARAGNPLIAHVYAADPSAHVWPGDDRLWLYTSHDQPGANTHDSMADYHVFSTRDGVNWVDYGMVLHVKDVKWAISHAWAIDAVYWKKLYYLVFCMKEKGTGMFRTGLATSKLPQGPFKDIGFIRGVEWGQDPALFLDDDGTPYLFWGAGGSCSGAKLTGDLLVAVPETVTNLTKQLTYVYEGPWVHKYAGKYYLSYPGLPGGWPEHMYYAVADKPLGPYTFKGEYVGRFDKQSGTDHGSIIEYKKRWLALYHSAWVSGGMSECRNLMADFLEYRDDGTIVPIEPTTKGIAFDGVKPGPSRCTILLEAENGEAAGGSLLECHVAAAQPGFSGSGYVEGFDGPGNAVTVMAQIAKPCLARLRIRYLAPDRDERHKVMVNAALVIDPVHGETSWEKLIVFPKAEQWTEMDLGLINLREGDNYIKFYSGRRGTIAIDCFEVEPVTP